MNQDIINRISDILRDNMDSSVGRLAVGRLLKNMSLADAQSFADELEAMASFKEFLTESEAVDIVNEFVNFDGSKGAHWDDPEVLFDAVGSLGIETERKERYNKWAFFTVMNMIWSDEWGVLRDYISTNDEVKSVAQLTQSRLTDTDGGFSVRRYFCLD